MSAFEIVEARGDEYLDDAAQIWAEATAARDADDEVAPLEVARPLIEGVLRGAPDAILLIAIAGDGAPLGFAVCEPIAARERRAELRYFGVRPSAWGRGVAKGLLDALRGRLRDRGFLAVELWVNDDNRRAIDVYRRADWQPAGEVRVNPRSGRQMQRYVLTLAARGSSG